MKALTTITILALVGLSGRAWGQPSIGSEEPPPWHSEGRSDDMFRLVVDRKTAERIEELVGKLAAPTYELREMATAALTEIGLPAFRRLRETYHTTEDLEVQLRVEQIVREAYLEHHVFGRNAFLGVSQSRFPLTHSDDPRVREGYFGVKIGRIIPGTAAARSVLDEGDVIIGLDGEPIGADARFGVPNFGESLRRRGPGTPLTLSVLREDTELEIHVILGARPKRYYRRQGLVSEMLRHFSEQFDLWWFERFRAMPEALEPDRAEEHQAPVRSLP